MIPEIEIVISRSMLDSSEPGFVEHSIKFIPIYVKNGRLGKTHSKDFESMLNSTLQSGNKHQANKYHK